MSNKDIENAKTGVEIIGEVIRLAGDSPNVKEAGNQLGQTALTITKTINNALLPLAAVNFAFDKARQYFAEKFADDLQEKAKKISPDNLIEPKASIAGPALQGLAFAHEEPDLKELFLELIAGAMDKSKSSMVHPGFVEILRQLEAEEAKILKAVLNGHIHPIAKLVVRNKKTRHHSLLQKHILRLFNSEDGSPAVIPTLPVMIDNWIRLGIVEVSYDQSLTDKTAYAYLEARPEMKNAPQFPAESDRAVEWAHGTFQSTAFGLQFSRAVGIS